jgi:hypothetical protein
VAGQEAGRDAVKAALRQQRIETPSWVFGNSGTRFKVFAQEGVPRTPREKIDDAAVLRAITTAVLGGVLISGGGGRVSGWCLPPRWSPSSTADSRCSVCPASTSSLRSAPFWGSVNLTADLGF